MSDLNSPTSAIYTHDNLPVLRGLNSECVDLICLDPPFNTGKQWHNPIGEGGGSVGFNDIWGWDRVTGETLEETIARQWEEERDYAGTAVREIVEAAVTAHSPQMGSYCAWMAPRLIELHRMLQPTGSIYLHCDVVTSHYLKTLLDAVFGRKNFRNEIVWHYHTSPGRPQRHFIKNTDTLLFYSRVEGENTHNPQKESWTKSTLKKWQSDSNGIYRMNNGKKYYIDPEGKLIDNVWEITLSSRSRERLGYPTQKPVALLSRLIAASSNPGDIVLDPFCGCATACVAAQKLERRWIGIDVEPQAVELCRRRLGNELGFEGITQELTAPPERNAVRQLELIPRNQKVRLALWQRMQEAAKQETPPCPACARSPGLDYMEVDHIVLRSRGGEHVWSNVQLLCGPCNRSKGNKTWVAWRRETAGAR